MKPKKKTRMVAKPAPLSLRRAKSAFRFDSNRDDLMPKTALTAWVFTTVSPVTQQGFDVGVYGSPVAVLTGYQATCDLHSKNRSVRAAEGPAAFVLGRLVEVTMEELARLDQVAERAGDYHRFLAEVTTASNGYKFSAWVFQERSDAGSVELFTSASSERPELLAPALRAA